MILRQFSWARFVSDVISPPVVWAVMVIPVSIQYSRTTLGAIGWAVLYSLFISAIPVIFVAYSVSQGKITDIHMKERRERYRPFLVSIACAFIAWVLFKTLNAPPAFPLLALLSLVQITVIALITLIWQISMHMMSIAGAAIITGIIFSISTAMMLVPVVMLVGAARLHLKRHTPAQVIGGTLVGALLPTMILGLIPMTLLQYSM